MIRLKRAYDPPSPDDGVRVLVDRLWPRGKSREALALDRWERDLAPSAELCKWFNHDLERWQEFQERYAQELSDPGKQAALQQLVEQARNGTVTLVYGARDEEHNQAAALKRYIEEHVA